jgi:hypothetical protein
MGPAQRLDAAMGNVKRDSQHVKLTAPLRMEPSRGGSSDMGPAEWLRQREAGAVSRQGRRSEAPCIRGQ